MFHFLGDGVDSHRFAAVRNVFTSSASTSRAQTSPIFILSTRFSLAQQHSSAQVLHRPHCRTAQILHRPHCPKWFLAVASVEAGHATVSHSVPHSAGSEHAAVPQVPSLKAVGSVEARVAETPRRFAKSEDFAEAISSSNSDEGRDHNLVRFASA